MTINGIIKYTTPIQTLARCAWSSKTIAHDVRMYLKNNPSVLAAMIGISLNEANNAEWEIINHYLVYGGWLYFRGSNTTAEWSDEHDVELYIHIAIEIDDAYGNGKGIKNWILEHREE